MMGKRDHSQLVATNLVDDAIRKLPKWQALPVSPGSADLRMRAQKLKSSLELCNEGKTQVCAAFSSVVDRSLG